MLDIRQRFSIITIAMPRADGRQHACTHSPAPRRLPLSRWPPSRLDLRYAADNGCHTTPIL
jgi:hypothetical protein